MQPGRQNSSGIGLAAAETGAPQDRQPRPALELGSNRAGTGVPVRTTSIAALSLAVTVYRAARLGISA